MIRIILTILLVLSGLVFTAGQDLLSVLSVHGTLSEFTSLISTHPNLVHAAEEGNVTILAPTNQAFDTFFASQTQATNYSSWDQIEALLSYHVLRGVHTRGFVTKEPQFLHTFLQNLQFTNVSGGQVAVAILDEDVVPVFRAAVDCSARHVEGEGDLVFLGGVVHIIDAVLVSSTTTLRLREDISGSQRWKQLT